MRMEWEVRDGQNVRVVDEKVLIAWWQERLRNDPTQQWRVRRKLAEQAAEDARHARDSEVLVERAFSGPNVSLGKLSRRPGGGRTAPDTPTQ